MALRSTHIRLGQTLYEELRDAAAREGVSLAEYIRGAAVARLARERALREASARSDPRESERGRAAR